MESNNNHHEDSKSSKDEDQTAAPDLNNDEMAGTGRSYECVFCKRGFTTAQALGGHMNIHRKERAIKTRPTSAPNFSTTTTTTTTSSKPATLGSYPAIHQTSYSTAPDDHHQLHHPHHHRVNYTTYIPSPTWVVGPPHAVLHPSDDHEEEDLYSARNCPRLDHLQSVFMDDQDWRSGRSLSLGIGPSSQYVDDDHHHHNKQIKLANGGSCNQLGDAHELDLELRLGHDP